jgi:hypothetical protein
MGIPDRVKVVMNLLQGNRNERNRFRKKNPKIGG